MWGLVRFVLGLKGTNHSSNSCQNLGDRLFYFEKKAIFVLSISGSSSAGRASAFQAECRRFEPGLPLKKVLCKQGLFLL